MIEVKAMANVTEFLNKPYARFVLQEPDGSFSAEIVEFPGCIAGGETASAALDCLNEVAIDWIKAAIAQGQSIPEPMYAADYSGLRMPKSDLALKYRAKLAAAATNTASNKRIIEAALELKEFITCEDGCVYWWPSGKGAVAAHELRTLADYLDMCNAEWESLIENDPLVSAEAKKEKNMSDWADKIEMQIWERARKYFPSNLIADALRQARQDALEEAAELAEGKLYQPENFGNSFRSDGGEGSWVVDSGYGRARMEVAAAIRKLGEE